MKEKCPVVCRTGMRSWIRNAPRPSPPPDTAPKGRYLGGPVTWGGFDDERIAALGLPFEGGCMPAPTRAMFAELNSARPGRKAPIMLWIYSPHWAPAKYEGEWVQFPEFTPECYADEGGGGGGKKYNCGKPHGEIWKYAWAA